jgi:hypothetical protein
VQLNQLNVRYGWKDDIASRCFAKQCPPMASIADDWWNEDRRDLFRSLEAIAAEACSPDRVGLCLDTILGDLELYDDPRQGAGAWLYENELRLAEQLGERLHEAADDRKPVEAGPTAVASAGWADARATANRLLQLMKANGDFTP